MPSTSHGSSNRSIMTIWSRSINQGKPSPSLKSGKKTTKWNPSLPFVFFMKPNISIQKSVKSSTKYLFISNYLSIYSTYLASPNQSINPSSSLYNQFAYVFQKISSISPYIIIHNIQTNYHVPWWSSWFFSAILSSKTYPLSLDPDLCFTLHSMLESVVSYCYIITHKRAFTPDNLSLHSRLPSQSLVNESVYLHTLKYPAYIPNTINGLQDVLIPTCVLCEDCWSRGEGCWGCSFYFPPHLLLSSRVHMYIFTSI